MRAEPTVGLHLALAEVVGAEGVDDGIDALEAPGPSRRKVGPWAWRRDRPTTFPVPEQDSNTGVALESADDAGGVPGDNARVGTEVLLEAVRAVGGLERGRGRLVRAGERVGQHTETPMHSLSSLLQIWMAHWK